MRKRDQKRRRLLQRCINELVALARELSPDGLTVRELAPFEDEDTVLEITVPERSGGHGLRGTFKAAL